MKQKRFEALREIGCVACRLTGQVDGGPVEIHHLNLGGKAGQKRRGDEYTIPLCLWHHRSVSYWGFPATKMTKMFGPSLAKQSRKFRTFYGDDDSLLAETNRRIGEQK